MLLRVRIEARIHTPGLDRAEQTFFASLDGVLNNLGRHLQRGLRGRVRRFRGDERKNVKYEVTGRGFNKALSVFGDLIQLWVDEYGLRPGVFQPWGIGSRIYRYVAKLGLVRKPFDSGARAKRPRRLSHVSTRRPGPRRAAGVQRTSPDSAGRTGRPRRYAAPVAQRSPAAERRARATRRIAFLVARAIFERGIKAQAPIARTFAANESKILRDIANAFSRAVYKINRGG